jgi:hypothetical protein
MIIERPCVRSAGSAAGESFAAVSIRKRRAAGSKRDALPRRLPQAEPFRDIRNAGIGNVGVAAGIKLMGLIGKCNFV